MEPGERQLHLRLHPGGTRYAAPRGRGLPGQVVQQHGLAHARTLRSSARRRFPVARLGVNAHTVSWLLRPIQPYRAHVAASGWSLCGHLKVAHTGIFPGRIAGSDPVKRLVFPEIPGPPLAWVSGQGIARAS